jgi:wyosine [tRNA(Phe)-imidazoG37] synthetase (radical SAM superfamily)
MIAFGPVPSRRLGQSLGINNIPPKVCTYSCVYCQLGKTVDMQVERRDFYTPDAVLQATRDKLSRASDKKETIDYMTFVADGEPTLDIHLRHEIERLKPLGTKIAVITNASLIDRPEVRETLMTADWVSLKMDTVQPDIWRKIDRPHKALNLSAILDGALEFAAQFNGTLVTETMLVRNMNDAQSVLEETAAFVARLHPAMAWLSIPTRPPAVKTVLPPDEKGIAQAYQIFSRHIRHVEYLIGYEGNAFAFTGDAQADLLSITAVHPMREEAVEAFLKKADADWTLVQRLIDEKKMIRLSFDNHDFYMRKLRSETL